MTSGGARVAAPCWSCAAAVETAALTCSSCGAILPALPASPFSRLGVASAFALDGAALERAWIDRSRKVHPDRFAGKSAAERRYAAEQTAALNDAYRAIRDPFDRAMVLVTAAGIDAGKLDQALLVTLMEARERAEESPADKAAVVAESTARYGELVASLASDLANLEDTPALRRAARTLAEMKTLARLVADLGGTKLIATLDER